VLSVSVVIEDLWIDIIMIVKKTIMMMRDIMVILVIVIGSLSHFKSSRV
jgi:hypothetical protein